MLKDNDEYGNDRNLISIEQHQNSWVLIGNENCKIIDDGNEVKSAVITLNKFYLLKIINKENTTDAMVYVCNENDTTYESYELEDGDYTIGSAPNQNIILNNNIISDEHAVLVKQDNKYTIKCRDDKIGLYIKTIDGALEILEIQGENAKKMDAKDFLRGNKLYAASVFE